MRSLFLSFASKLRLKDLIACLKSVASCLLFLPVYRVSDFSFGLSSSANAPEKYDGKKAERSLTKADNTQFPGCPQYAGLFFFYRVSNFFCWLIDVYELQMREAEIHMPVSEDVVSAGKPLVADLLRCSVYAHSWIVGSCRI